MGWLLLYGYDGSLRLCFFSRWFPVCDYGQGRTCDGRGSGIKGTRWAVLLLGTVYSCCGPWLPHALSTCFPGMPFKHVPQVAAACEEKAVLAVAV